MLCIFLRVVWHKTDRTLWFVCCCTVLASRFFCFGCAVFAQAFFHPFHCYELMICNVILRSLQMPNLMTHRCLRIFWDIGIFFIIDEHIFGHVDTQPCVCASHRLGDRVLTRFSPVLYCCKIVEIFYDSSDMLCGYVWSCIRSLPTVARHENTTRVLPNRPHIQWQYQHVFCDVFMKCEPSLTSHSPLKVAYPTLLQAKTATLLSLLRADRVTLHRRWQHQYHHYYYRCEYLQYHCRSFFLDPFPFQRLANNEHCPIAGIPRSL